MAKLSRSSAQSSEAVRRRAIMIKMDDEIRNELDVLARMQGKTVPELGLEAICDLLRKHGRPVSIRDAFKRSAGEPAAKKPRAKTSKRRSS